MVKSDPGHFGQVVIEQIRQFLGLQLVGGFGETGDVREEDRQLLSSAGELDLLATGEDRLVDLWR